MKSRSAHISTPERSKRSWMARRKHVDRRSFGTASTKRLSGTGTISRWDHSVDESTRQLDVLILPATGSLGVHSGILRAINGTQRKPTAIFLTKKISLKELLKSIDLYDLLVLPSIDYSGENGAWADFSLSNRTPAKIEEVLAQTFEINARLKLIEQTDRSNQAALLARIYSRDKGLLPVYDPTNKALITFKEEHMLVKVQKIAEDCVRAGLLERKFFNRIHACPSCNSSRLNVREECGHCRSADLEELSVIHHFRCGYIGPESDFGDEEKLNCPKCRKRLKHFSIDYDRPGSIMECNSCGHSSKVTDVGFECADCGTHNDTEVVHTRSYHSYTLTNQGEEFLQELPDPLHTIDVDEDPSGPDLERFEDHSIRDFIADLRKYERSAIKPDHQFSLVELTFGEREALLKSKGQRAVDQLQKLFFQSLVELIGADSRAYLVNEHFFVLNSHCEPGNVEDLISDIAQTIIATLNFNPGVEIRSVTIKDAEKMMREIRDD